MHFFCLNNSYIMVIIFSQAIEHTTIQVIDWIVHCNGSFKRINGTDFYKDFNLKITSAGTELDLENVNWSEANVIWLWRWMGFEERHDNFFRQNSKAIDPIKYQLNQFLRAELKTLISFFFNFVPKQKLFSRADMEELNKLLVLNKARELGIDVPKTFVLAKKKAFNSIRENAALITKALSNAPIIEHEGDTFHGYTAVVAELPDESSDQFSPSLFQDHIQKKYEIRSFFLGGNFYSMAIFSQSDEQTTVDFRVYNYVRPNRTVPFQLPRPLEDKLRTLLDFFQLKSGSIDIIKTTDNRYVFLEINCSGQFGMVSIPCNYYLEKKMAQELIKHNSNEI